MGVMPGEGDAPAIAGGTVEGDGSWTHCLPSWREWCRLLFERAQSAKKGWQLSKLALNSQGQGAKPYRGSVAASERSG